MLLLPVEVLVFDVKGTLLNLEVAFGREGEDELGCTVNVGLAPCLPFSADDSALSPVSTTRFGELEGVDFLLGALPGCVALKAGPFVVGTLLFNAVVMGGCTDGPDKYPERPPFGIGSRYSLRTFLEILT